MKDVDLDDGLSEGTAQPLAPDGLCWMEQGRWCKRRRRDGTAEGDAGQVYRASAEPQRNLTQFWRDGTVGGDRYAARRAAIREEAAHEETQAGVN